MPSLSPTSTALAAVLLATSSAGAASFEKKDVYQSETRPAEVEIVNLVGSARIVPAKGSTLVVEYTIVAGGSDDAAARALAERVTLASSTSGGELRLELRYPTDQHKAFVYRRDGIDVSTQTEYLGERVRITSDSARGAVPLHVDLVVQVPEGTRVALEHAVGELAAEGLKADVELELGAGRISARDGQGRLSADTGSGDVSVLNQRGEVSADTGSGDVSLEGIQGRIDIDTGSGDVRIRSSRGDAFELDTGSGQVTIEDSSASLELDTGSGGLEARGFVAGSRMHVDTGSGDLEIGGDLSALRDLEIDAGSGEVSLATSKALDLRLAVDANSGDIDVELPDMRDVRSERGAFQATLGGGSGRAEIDTGSGDVRITMVR